MLLDGGGGWKDDDDDGDEDDAKAKIEIAWTQRLHPIMSRTIDDLDIDDDDDENDKDLLFILSGDRDNKEADRPYFGCFSTS